MADEANKKTRIRGRIAFDVMETGEDGKLYVIRHKTIREIYEELAARLRIEDNLPDEYFCISLPEDDKYGSGLTRDDAWPPYHWIACYPVTGGSEGHYIHVDIIDKEGRATNIFLGKTLRETRDGFDYAASIAAACAWHLGA